MNPAIDRVILVPGLLEPNALFWPLSYVLKGRGARVEYFADRIIFRNPERSVARLAASLDAEDSSRSIAIVTHSFGDWVARQAIARTANTRTAALVSVAPVMQAGWVTRGMRLVSRDLIPELNIITDPQQSAQQLDCGGSLRRLVIWAKADIWVRPVPLDHVSNVGVQCVAATHLTAIAHPNVLKMIQAFLFPDP
jgi:hypothetical protein